MGEAVAKNIPEACYYSLHDSYTVYLGVAKRFQNEFTATIAGIPSPCLRNAILCDDSYVIPIEISETSFSMRIPFK
jgi:hypothetical protein